MNASASPSAQRSSSTRGSYVVLGMFGVGLALAAFAWWWNLSQNRRCVGLWGQETVRLVRQAPQVELWELTPADDPAAADNELIEDVVYQVRRRDISQARGLIHARYALTDDPSFDWSQANSKPAAKWTLAFRFTERDQTATFLIDPFSKQVRLLESGVQATAIERILAGWQRLAERR